MCASKWPFLTKKSSDFELQNSQKYFWHYLHLNGREKLYQLLFRHPFLPWLLHIWYAALTAPSNQLNVLSKYFNGWFFHKLYGINIIYHCYFLQVLFKIYQAKWNVATYLSSKDASRPEQKVHTLSTSLKNTLYNSFIPSLSPFFSPQLLTWTCHRLLRCLRPPSYLPCPYLHCPKQ